MNKKEHKYLKIVKKIIENLLPEDTAEQIAEKIEELELNEVRLADITKEKEEKMKWELE